MTQRYAAEHGNRIDYAASLLMVDNYLPGFDIKKQISKLPEKDVDANLTRIIADINAHKKKIEIAALYWRLATKLIQTGEKLIMRDTQAQGYIVTEKCNRCGTCAKVCPSGNIAVTDKVNFGVKCEWCLGCVHLCPRNAIHLKSERSSDRWCNPNVTLSEIISANNRTKLK